MTMSGCAARIASTALTPSPTFRDHCRARARRQARTRAACAALFVLDTAIESTVITFPPALLLLTVPRARSQGDYVGPSLAGIDLTAIAAPSPNRSAALALHREAEPAVSESRARSHRLRRLDRRVHKSAVARYVTRRVATPPPAGGAIPVGERHSRRAGWRVKRGTCHSGLRRRVRAPLLPRVATRAESSRSSQYWRMSIISSPSVSSSPFRDRFRDRRLRRQTEHSRPRARVFRFLRHERAVSSAALEQEVGAATSRGSVRSSRPSCGASPLVRSGLFAKRRLRGECWRKTLLLLALRRQRRACRLSLQCTHTFEHPEHHLPAATRTLRKRQHHRVPTEPGSAPHRSGSI